MNIRRTASLLLITALFAGCASAPIIRIDQGAPQPHLVSLEQKIMEDSRQLEEKFSREGAVYNSPAAIDYITQLGQRVQPELGTASFSFDYGIVRDPTVNAFALPTGRSYYHLGLIAPMRNPDMLAAVMAHEMSHSFHRDTLYLLDDFHQKTVAAKLTEIVLVPGAAVFGMGSIASLMLNTVYASAVTGYGRDKEARADISALERLQAVGMNPAAVVQMLEVLLKESDRYQKGLEIWFLMSHPSNRQRIADATNWLAEHGITEIGPPEDDAEFLALTDPLRLEAARMNIQFQRYFHALDIINDLLTRQPDSAAVLTLEGVCYQKLADDLKMAKDELSAKAWAEIKPKNDAQWKSDWQEKAQEKFARAIELDSAFGEAYRGLGFLCVSRAESGKAVENLEKYLLLSPDAKDKRFVNSQINQLKKSEAAGS